MFFCTLNPLHVSLFDWNIALILGYEIGKVLFTKVLLWGDYETTDYTREDCSGRCLKAKLEWNEKKQARIE